MKIEKGPRPLAADALDHNLNSHTSIIFNCKKIKVVLEDKSQLQIIDLFLQ